MKPSQRKVMAKHMVSNHNINIKLACIAFGISESCYRYQAKLSSENAEIADWFVKLTEIIRDAIIVEVI